MAESERSGVKVTRGDTGVDRSHNEIDNSRHTTIHRDSHDVHTDVRIDNSQRNVTVQMGSGAERSSALWWVLGGALTLLAALVPVFWREALAPQPPPSFVVNVPVTMGTSAGQEPVRTPPPVVQANREVVATSPGPASAVPPAAVPTAVPAPPPEPGPSVYVNGGAQRSGTTYVLMVDSRTGADVMLTQQVGALVGGADDLFKPAFVREGVFSRVHQGDTDVLRRLVDPAVGRVILGTRSASFSPTQVAGQALVRASVTLNARIIEPSRGFVSTVASASDIGAGFDEQSALALATENALKKLSGQLRR